MTSSNRKSRRSSRSAAMQTRHARSSPANRTGIIGVSMIRRTPPARMRKSWRSSDACGTRSAVCSPPTRTVAAIKSRLLNSKRPVPEAKPALVVVCDGIWKVLLEADVRAVVAAFDQHSGQRLELAGVDRGGLIGRVGDGVKERGANLPLVGAQRGEIVHVFIAPEL